MQTEGGARSPGAGAQGGVTDLFWAEPVVMSTQTCE